MRSMGQGNWIGRLYWLHIYFVRNIMHLFKIQWNGNKSQSFQTITTPSPIHFSSSSLHPVGIPSKPLNYIQLMHGNFRYENFAFVRLNKSDERESSVRSSVRAPSDGKREKERVCCICSCNIRRPSDASAWAVYCASWRADVSLCLCV